MILLQIHTIFIAQSSFCEIIQHVFWWRIARVKLTSCTLIVNISSLVIFCLILITYSERKIPAEHFRIWFIYQKVQFIWNKWLKLVEQAHRNSCRFVWNRLSWKFKGALVEVRVMRLTTRKPQFCTSLLFVVQLAHIFQQPKSQNVWCTSSSQDSS